MLESEALEKSKKMWTERHHDLSEAEGSLKGLKVVCFEDKESKLLE